MNISKNLYLKVALACFSVTLLAHAEVEPAKSMLSKKSTTIVGGNLGGDANNFVELQITTGNKNLDEYRQNLAEFLAPLDQQLPHISDSEMLKRFGTSSREEAQKIAKNFNLTRGPAICEVLPESYRKPLVHYVQETSGKENAQKLNELFDLIHKTNFGSERAYSTFCLESVLLGAEKQMMDAEKDGMPKFRVPTLDNPNELLHGPTRDDAKLGILKAVLTKNAVSLATTKKGAADLAKTLAPVKEGKVSLPTAFIKTPEMFNALTSSGVGYCFAYAAQQATLTHMQISHDAELATCNSHKEIWKNSAGDLETKINGLLNPVLEIKPDVYCTQEASTPFLVKAEQSDLFLSVDKQPRGDGSHIFLNKNSFANYTVIPLPNYKKNDDANLLLIEAHRNKLVSSIEDPIELYASFHASSRNPKDRLEIIDALAEKAKDIHAKTGRVVVLRVEGDANTDSSAKVTEFLKHCSEHGFQEVCQMLGQKLLPTVAKMRVLSVQIRKMFAPDRNIKDFSLVLVVGTDTANVTKPVSDLTGFEQPYDRKRNLPDGKYPADHYPKITTYADNF